MQLVLFIQFKVSTFRLRTGAVANDKKRRSPIGERRSRNVGERLFRKFVLVFQRTRSVVNLHVDVAGVRLYVHTCLLYTSGDGVQREELQARINSYPCKEKIIFAGFRRDIKHLLAGSDVFVLPSHIETFSLSILQAFAAGTPCVASDVGGTPEQILPRLNGLLFQDNDSTELASRLNEILNDEEFRCYLTHNAIVLSHSYLNDNRMIGDIENLYGRLISK